MIRVENLYKKFGQNEILKGVNLNIEPNMCTAIFGLSGGGKSTIIKHIVGLLKPTSGSIIYKDKIDITKLNEYELREVRKEIGFLFQSGALFDSMNVYDNVAFPLKEHTNLSSSEIKKRVLNYIDMVGLNPNKVLSLYPNELSGGMKKRVGLARTLMLEPKVILYDEPTSGLDPVTSDVISQMIIKLQNELNTTSILISHDIKETFKSANRFAMLYQGEIIEYGNEEQFKNSKSQVVQDFLSGNSQGSIDFVAK
jgi:phospholipid/cholesterol/gamma-HCH transport system ATP-binding protein